jgi:CVNH domain
MALHKTTREFRLDGAILTAKCEDNNKEWKDSTINLDDIYGNIDGEFVAGYTHFSASAQELSIDKDDTGVWLRAELRDYENNYKQASARLDAQIINDNGILKHD